MSTGAHVEELASSVSSRLQTTASRLGCTEGQLYTAGIGLVLATSLAVLGVPTALREPLAAAPGAAQSALPEAPVVIAPLPESPANPLPELPPPGPLGPLDAQPLPVESPAGPGAASQPPVGPGAETDPQGRVISVFARIDNPGSPAAVAYLPNGDVVVGTNNTSGASTVRVFSSSGDVLRNVAVPGQPEERASGLVAAAADSAGRTFVLDGSTSRVLQLDPNSKTLTTRASVPNVPLCLVGFGAPACEAGLQDRTGRLSAIAVDARGSLYIADAGQGIIWRLLAGETATQPWYSASEFATGDGQAGLAFDGQGRLLFTAGTTNDLGNLGNGGLYRLAVNEDGTAGARTLVHPFGKDERPGALAVGASGTSYVIARGTGAIVGIDDSGAEVSRLAPPGDGQVPLDTPEGLAIGPGFLLVANQGSAESKTNWAILKVLVEDRPIGRRR